MNPLDILTADGDVPISLALIVVNLVALGFMYRENKKQLQTVRSQLSKRIDDMENKISIVEHDTKKKVEALEIVQHSYSAKITEMYTDIKWIKNKLDVKL